MSDDDYPTKAELNQVKECSSDGDTLKLVELLKAIWWMPDGIVLNGNRLELHTYGWSGNEEIIKVMEKSIFWALCWQRSDRGGHYYFETGEGSE